MEKKRNSTTMMHLTCAIIFVLFTYLYLSCYQEDVLAVAQHELSGGLTQYNYVISPILTTFVLFLLQLGVFAVTRVKKSFHVLTYFPSLLILAVITDIPVNVDTYQSLGAWAWIVPLLLIAFGGGMWVVRQLEPYEAEIHNNSWLSKWTWQNVLQMVIMMVLVVLVAQGNQVFHSRMKMEHLMGEHQYTEALEVGSKMEQTDSSLTMLRVACLHRTNQMGDLLFTYPLVGGSKAMFPDSVTVKAMMWKAPKWMYPTHSKKYRYRIPDDYQLCGLLMDKKLDQFVALVSQKCNIVSPSLPKHYKEALILYSHRRAHPKIIYRNPVMEADFQDYQTLERKYSNAEEKQSALRDMYGNTYWYYYQYGQK